MVEGLLDSLDQLLTTIFVEIGNGLRNVELKDSEQTSRAEYPLHWSVYCPWDREVFNGVPQGRVYPVPRGGIILFFAIENGLARYPLEKLSQSKAGTMGEHGIALLISACRATTISPSVKGLIRPAVVKGILRLRADPNRSCPGVDSSGQPFSTTPWGEMLHTVRGLEMTSLEGIHQVFEMLKGFLEKGADPAAQITWTKREHQSSTRRTFNRTAKEQIKQTFIDCFPAKETSVPHDDEETIPFVPFQDLVSDDKLARSLSASTSIHRQHVTAHTEGSRLRSGSRWFPAESEVEQVKEWGNSLIKLLESEREVSTQSCEQRPSRTIYYKLRLKSDSLGIRFAHLRRLKRWHKM